MARWTINAHPIIVMAAIVIGSDHILIGIWQQLRLAWIIYCLILTVGSTDRFHLAVLGYQPRQSVRQLSQEAFTAISREGVRAILIVTKSSCRGLSPFVKVEIIFID